MNYVWAAVLTLVVLIVLVCGIIAVHRWASTKKTKIALDVIVTLVTGVVALASQTFIGALQVFPSAAARPTPAGAPSTSLCPAQYTGALIQLWPNAVKRSSHVTIAGDGFPANDVVEITFHPGTPSSNGELGDIGAVRSDACGKFNYSWNIPGSLITPRYPAIEVIATDQKPGSDGVKNCCRATATLTVNVIR